MEDDIAAFATPPGEGALAVVRVAGPGAVQRLACVFSRPDVLRSAEGYTAVYGKLKRAGGLVADEVVVVVFRAPKSYTGQDGADVMCHGGAATAELVLAALTDAGFKQALPGEFTFRAYHSGKIDLIEAQAVDELVKARTRGAQADAMKRLSGALTRELESLRRELRRLAAACALRLDYGEDEAPEDLADELPALRKLRAAFEDLAASYQVGRMLKEGAVVALAGRTNAGKSSLFNRFLREERAIVSDAHGTTRDYLEADLDLGGIPVRLMDTAGLRDSVDPIEAEGVRRSLLLAEGADAILYVVDAAAGLTAEDEEFLRDRKDALRVWNKIDLPGARPSPPGWHAVSAKDGRGETGLASALRLALSGAGGPEHAAAPEGIVGARLSSAAQRDAVQRSVRALKDAELALEDGLPADAIALDIAEALDALGEVMGETTGEDVLDALFGNFCVGK